MDADEGDQKPKDENATGNNTDPDEPQNTDSEGDTGLVRPGKGFVVADFFATTPPLDLGIDTLGLTSGLTEFTRSLSYLDEPARQIRALTAGLDSIVQPMRWVTDLQLSNRSVVEGIGKSLLQLTSFHDTVRQSLDLFVQDYKTQWQGIFETLADMARRAY